MENLSDQELIALAIQNNQDALQTFVARYLKLVYSFSYTYVKTREDAEDVTQEVFAKVWLNLKKYDASKPLRPWLYRIAKNTCLDFLKKRPLVSFSDLQPNDDEQWLSQSIIDEKPLPEHITDKSLLKDQIAQALNGLSPKYAQVVSLYHNEELNFREISKKTGQPLNTVKSQYRRALSALKQIISK